MTLEHLDPALLEHATDDELDEILYALRSARVQLDDWNLQPRQQKAEDLCGEASRDAAFELLYGGAAGGGKGLDLGTPMMAASGDWVLLGGLVEGDRIFGPDGQTTTIVGVFDADGRDCYEVRFDDGEVLIADDVHRWEVWTEADRAARARRSDLFRERRRASRPERGTGARPDLAQRNRTAAWASRRPDPPAGRVVSTTELIALMASERRRIAIRMHDPVELPDAELPLDPYLYGCWLGDGHTHNGRITTADPEIIDTFRQAFPKIVRYDDYTYAVHGLRRVLAAMGELGGKTGHGDYLNASPKQRLACLQGLMDTDGTATTAGTVEFTSTNRQIADFALALIRSLGWKARIRIGRATLDGRDCGPHYRIKWTPNEIVFRLARKIERQRLGGERTRWRYITSITPTTTRPTRCIAVDHPSHCFLAGRALTITHNTDWLLWHVWTLAVRYPGSRCLYLRRTFPELYRSAIARSLERYDRKVAKWVDSKKEWRFVNGSVIEFGYLETPLDQYNFQSAEYVCVDPLTPVLMADGAWRSISTVSAGDWVQTLEGPRLVLRSAPVDARESVEIDTGTATVIAALDHRIYCGPDSGWRTPRELLATSPLPDGTMLGGSPWLSRGARRHAGSTLSGRLRSLARWPLTVRRAVRQETFGPGRSVRGTGDGASYGSPRAWTLPPSWSGRVMLHEPARLVAEAAAPPHALPHEWIGSPGRGSPDDCRPDPRSDDGRSRPVQGTDLTRTPSQGGAARRAPTGVRVDDPATIRGHSRTATTYAHPYTSEARPARAAVLPAWVSIRPAGVRPLWDLQVDAANHYISWGGILHRNCVAWDELTQWPTDQSYRYLMSRLRAPYELTRQGLVPHTVAATNPGNVGGGWVRKRFIDSGPPEVIHETRDAESGVRCRRVFVPAKLEDNFFIDQEAYDANLSMLDEATRKALRDGSWDVVEGQYFTEFDRDVHVVAPFAIPSWWTRIRGYDFGHANPAAMVWLAFDGDGNGYVYREFYQAGLTIPAQAARIKDLSVMVDETGRTVPEPIDYTVADPSIWTQTGAGPPIASQFTDNGVVMRRAKNARVDGWLRVREFLAPDTTTGEPRLRFFETCTDLIRTLPMLVRDVAKPEDLNCFVAGTMVDTPSGPRPVECLAVGDLVSTPVGDRPIIRAGVSGVGPVWSVGLSTGEKLTGTPDHCVVTLNRGLVPLDQLSEGDVLCDKITGWLSSESPTTGSSTPDTKAAPTTTRTAVCSPEDSDPFTNRSTSTLTGSSRQGITSTTSTTTTTTTTRRTSSPSPPRTMPVTISPSVAPIPSHARPCTSGITRTRAEPCCETTHGRCETTRQREATRASVVAELARRHPSNDGSVRTPANTSGNAPTATFENARSAVGHSEARSPQRTRPAPVRISAAGSYAGEDRVYQLTVAEVGLYYANGVLVTNTDGEDHLADALRYGLMSRMRGPREPGLAATTLEGRIAEKHRRKWKQGSGGRVDHPVVGWL